MLTEANTPYTPQRCSPVLAKRIFEAAGKVKLFESIHHWTSESTLKNAFNDCLYGRRTLLQHYLSFEPAALSISKDLEFGGGDANVICFGVKGIDPKADQDNLVDLEFNLHKLETNPGIFYKQRDLGYWPEKIRTLSIGKEQHFSFSHTHFSTTEIGKKAEIGHINLQIFGQNGRLIGYSELPNYLFIAYDISHMHQILTLNFFRFLDTLTVPQRKEEQTKVVPANDIIESIYADIDKLEDKELIDFLTTLGQEMTDTAEFNFYGAYKINFSALRSITKKGWDLCLMSELPKDEDEEPEKRKVYLDKQNGKLKYIVFSSIQDKIIEGELDIPVQGDLTKEFLSNKKSEILKIISNTGIATQESDYELDLPNFISELQSGNEKILKEALEKIPVIFESYRFLDYLLSEVNQDAIRKNLLQLRKKAFVKAPTWMRELHEMGITRNEDFTTKPLPPYLPLTSRKLSRLDAKEAKEEVEIKRIKDKPSKDSEKMQVIQNKLQKFSGKSFALKQSFSLEPPPLTFSQSHLTAKKNTTTTVPISLSSNPQQIDDNQKKAPRLAYLRQRRISNSVKDFA